MVFNNYLHIQYGPIDNSSTVVMNKTRLQSLAQRTLPKAKKESNKKNSIQQTRKAEKPNSTLSLPFRDLIAFQKKKP